MAQRLDLDALYNISPGKHFYQFYKNSYDFFYLMTSFFQAGLEKAEACLWLVSKRNGLEAARVTMEEAVPGFSLCAASGQFQILSAEEWYLTEGTFDEDKAMANAGAYLERVQKQGFPRLRGAGDAGAVNRRDWPAVEVYEKKISSWIRSQPLVALCAYPILELTPSQTKGILDCHDDVLMGRFS